MGEWSDTNFVFGRVDRTSGKWIEYLLALAYVKIYGILLVLLWWQMNLFRLFIFAAFSRSVSFEVYSISIGGSSSYSMLLVSFIYLQSSTVRCLTGVNNWEYLDLLESEPLSVFYFGVSDSFLLVVLNGKWMEAVHLLSSMTCSITCFRISSKTRTESAINS